MCLCATSWAQEVEGIHKTFRRHSMTTYWHPVCFQHISCAMGVRFFKIFFPFYYNKIHQVTNYIAITNKINKTRQHRTNKRKQNKMKEKINKK